MALGEESRNEYKPPSPDEIGDEIRRTKEKRSAEPGEFLAVENIPSWLNDIGQERDDDDPLEEALKVFRGFPVKIRRDIIRQIEFERQRKSLGDEAALERLKFLVEKNDDILKQGAEIKTSQIKYDETAEELLKSKFGELKEEGGENLVPEAGTPKNEPVGAARLGWDARKYTGKRGKYESHGQYRRKRRLPKSLKERKRTREETQKAAERFQKDSKR